MDYSIYKCISLHKKSNLHHTVNCYALKVANWFQNKLGIA